MKKFYIEEILLYKRVIKTLEDLINIYKTKTLEHSEILKEYRSVSWVTDFGLKCYLKKRLKVFEAEFYPIKKLNLKYLTDQMLKLSKKLDELYEFDLKFNEITGEKIPDNVKIKYFEKK